MEISNFTMGCILPGEIPCKSKYFKRRTDQDGTWRPFEVNARKSSAYDCIFRSDYHKPCNVGMVPIFCVINYK